MLLKAPPLEIPANNPFEKDQLGREKCALALTELLKSSADPLVLSVNAPWGEGKSTFAMMWRQMLRNERFKTLYFNAWENDFSNDALVSIISELDLGIQELSEGLNEKKVVIDHLNKAKKVGVKLIKRSLPTALKIATAGLVNVDELTDEALANLSEKLAEDQIKQYESSKQSVNGFREQLLNISSAISEHDENGKQLPLVIIVDELDRCRPTYAINVIEAIKHFFSVKNIVYVLAIDKEQLGHSIRSMYGSGMDVEGYLKRFIDIDFNLPIPDSTKFCKAQFERFGLLAYFKARNQQHSQYDLSNIQQIFSDLFLALNLSLREQERVFTTLSLAIRTTPERFKLYPHLLSFLIILKIKNNGLYADFVRGKKNSSDLMDYIKLTPKGKEFAVDHYGTVIEALLLCCRTRHIEVTDLTKPYEEILANSNVPLEKERANKIINLLRSYELRDDFGVLSYIVNKIDLVSNFDN
jgi:hypothetical protein